MLCPGVVRDMKEPPARCRRLDQEPPGSDDPNVLRFLALSAGSDVELDPLAFLERPVTTALDVGVMYENVLTLLSGDESEALL